MRILVNGGSLSRGPGSWPYHVQQSFKADMVNLSQAGCGNSYIHETTIAELAQRHYDLVMIQWPPFIRFDYKVSDPRLFDGTTFTSKYQSGRNDWSEKKIIPENDQDYVEKDWIFGCGYAANNEKDPCLVEAFAGYYKYTGSAERLYHSTMRLISLQSFLKVKKIPYVYCFGRPWKLLDRYKHITNLIDMEHFFTEYYLLDIARKFNWWDPDGLHPNTQAYAYYAEKLLPKIHRILDAQT